jgi:hypothetical protein
MMKQLQNPYATAFAWTKRIALGSLVGLLAAFVLWRIDPEKGITSATGVSSFFLSMISGVALLISLICVPLYANLARRCGEQLRELVENPTAHWTFQGSEWAKCNQNQLRKKRFHLTVFWILGVLCLAGAWAYFLSVSNNPSDRSLPLYVALALLVCVVLIGSVWHLSIQRWWTFNSEREGEVYLAPGILWCSPSTMYAWGLAGSFVELHNIELVHEEPIRLHCTFVVGAGQNQHLKEVNLPVPPEKLEEVQPLFAQEALFGPNFARRLLALDEKSREEVLRGMAALQAVAEMPEEQREALFKAGAEADANAAPEPEK